MTHRWTDHDRLAVYKDTLEEIRDNYECECDEPDVECRVCMADKALRGIDPWGRDRYSRPWDLDEMAPGDYLAYVSGYSNDGIGLELYAENVTPRQIKVDPDLEGVYVQTLVMPDCNMSVKGGDLLLINVKVEGGYTVVKHLGSKYAR